MMEPDFTWYYRAVMLAFIVLTGTFMLVVRAFTMRCWGGL